MELIKDKSKRDPLQVENENQRNARRARGEVTNEEIEALWNDPSKPFFEHEFATKTKDGKEIRTKFALWALTEKHTPNLLKEMQSAWKDDFEAYSHTLGSLLPIYRRTKNPPAIKLEYYVVTDESDHPFGMAGVYSEDYKGTRGFINRNMLDPEKHYLVASGGWGVMSRDRKYRRTGMGSRFLFPWVGKMAKSRGANMMSVYCDDWSGEDTARSLYKKWGFKEGFDVKNFFGPGRDLFTYYADITKEKIREVPIPEENINRNNADGVMKLAESIYSKERCEELKVCLELLFRQRARKDSLPPVLAVRVPNSFVKRNAAGELESFAIYSNMIYENAVEVFWAGSEPGNMKAKKELFDIIKQYTKKQDREMIVFGREGQDNEIQDQGFESANDGVPGVFEKGDDTRMIFFTRKLDDLQAE